MSKRFCITVVIFLAVVLVVLVWQVLRPRESEPIYKGKTLSQWEAEKKPTDFDPSISTPAIDALRQMGTNALPYLIQDLRSKDALFWRKLPRSAYSLRLIIRIRLMCGPPAWERQDRAIYFLKALGSMAKPAIPALSECLDRPEIAEQSADILGHYDSIGRVGLGTEATPPLLKAMTNGNASVRRIAANALGLLKTKPDLVVPALIHALKDPSPEVRSMAARSFGGYKTEAASIVPALIDTLDDTDSYVRQGTLWMLGMYGGRASASVPKLLFLLKDPDFQVRKEATNALKLIDPEAAAKAGLQ